MAKRRIKQVYCIVLVMLLLLLGMDYHVMAAEPEQMEETEELLGAGSNGYIWPTPGVSAISQYYSSGHTAIDIAAPMGTNVVAVKAGTIKKFYRGCNSVSNNVYCANSCSPSHNRWTYAGRAYCNNGIGNGILVQHDDGTWAEYAHMQNGSFPSGVYEGARVEQGQFLGKTGSSGNSTGPHIHFRLCKSFNGDYWANGNYNTYAINPLLVVSASDVINTTPGTPVISARSTYYTDENITFSWSTAANAATYGISLYTRPSSGERTLVYDKAGVTGNSYSIGKFAVGNYRLWLAGYSSSGVRGATTYVDISVTKRPVIYVSSISLNKTALTLTKGQSATLTASVSPANANNKSVSWTTSNSKVATVSNGTVKAVGVGTATITAKAADGSGKTAVCSVTVKDNHKHSYSAKVTKAPTCTATGVRTYTCSCGASYTEQIEKTAHKVVTDSAVAATCTMAGKTEGSHCSVCGAVIKQQAVIPQKEHNYQESSIEKASPGKNGAVIRKCSSCGNSISTTIYAPQKIELSKTKYTYNGKTRKPSVTVTDNNGNILNAGADYTVSYSKGCKKVGNYTVTVKFTGNYSGKSKETFTIAPKGTKITGYRGKTKSSVVIYWKKQANQTGGYEIQYSTNSSFTKDATKTMTIKKKGTTSKTLSKLKKNQTYYVRVRTYQTVRVNGKSKKIASDWSKAVEIAR